MASQEGIVGATVEEEGEEETKKRKKQKGSPKEKKPRAPPKEKSPKKPKYVVCLLILGLYEMDICLYCYGCNLQGT